MFYRRNVDDRLRQLERAWQSDPADLTLFLNYNRERHRAGLERIILPKPATYSELSKILTEAIEPFFQINKLSETLFSALEIKKDILDSTYPIIPRKSEQVKTLDSILESAAELCIQLGWVGVIHRPKTVVLRLRRKPETNEWTVRWVENGRDDEGKAYYTDDKEDAQNTLEHMQTEIKLKYPTLYLVPRTVIELTGEPLIRPPSGLAGSIVADQWTRYEDPRSLVDPQFRRGSYPVKTVLVFVPGPCPTCNNSGKIVKTLIDGHEEISLLLSERARKTSKNLGKGVIADCICQKYLQAKGSYITWRYYVPYEEGVDPSFNHGHYSMGMVEGYTDYIHRLLKLPGDDTTNYYLYM